MSMVHNLLLNCGNYAGDKHVDCNRSDSDCNFEEVNDSPQTVAVPAAISRLINILDGMVVLRILEEAYSRCLPRQSPQYKRLRNVVCAL